MPLVPVLRVNSLELILDASLSMEFVLQLHWLPIEYQIHLNIMVLTFKEGDQNIFGTVSPHICHTGPLHSVNQHLLVIYSPKDIQLA